MKRKLFVIIAASVLVCTAVTGCAASPDSSSSDKAESTIKETTGQSDAGDEEKTDSKKKDKKKKKNDGKSEERSLAQRMAGKYSYHTSGEDGEEEYYIMDVVPFGDNLYAFCGRVFPDGDDSFAAYTFWATEFIPYDADEMRSTDGDEVKVNELRFSVMSNAGKYWDSGHAGTIALTDKGLVFEGFDHEGFLVPDNDESRLFLKDDRVEDTFDYVKDGKGDDELEGLWILDREGADLYIEFAGANMYMYSKDPGSEVFYAAGGCEYSDGAFLCTANCLGGGGMPLELDCRYETDGDTLRLSVSSYDLADEIPAKGKYTKIKDGGVHVTTMDEVTFDSESFGMFGADRETDESGSQEYYGVFVTSAKDPDKCTPTIDKLEEEGFDGSLVVYTPDYSELNPEPYYVVTTGLYTSESEAKEALSRVKAAGFTDAYVKFAGVYKGD